MAYSTKVQTLEYPWLKAVEDADPDWRAGRRRQLVYDFPSPGRWFYEDPYTSGPYRTEYLLWETRGLLLQESGGKIIISGPSPGADYLTLQPESLGQLHLEGVHDELELE